MSAERTEQATPKHRSESRKRGDIPRSTELTGAIMILSMVLFFRWYAPYAMEQISNVMRHYFANLYQPEFSIGDLQYLLWSVGTVFARVMAPILALVIVLSVTSTIMQGGLVFAWKRIKPDVNRANPAKGMKRLASKSGAFDSGKAIMKLIIVGAVTYPLIRHDVEYFAGLTGSSPVMVGRAIGSALSDLALRTGGAFLVLAMIDYGYQRWEFEQKLKMTKQQVKDEHRQNEGNPEIKARVRRIQRQMARGRMLQNVPSATVVVTNPTHIAVAIRFDLRSTPVPLVVAKGSGEVAKRIKEMARSHSIPIIENKPLARALHQLADVGTEIPFTLYEAVADVIAYVYGLRSGRVLKAE